MASDLWVVTSFFNPSKYLTKRKNYDAFVADLISAGVPCLTVECAFGAAPFELASADGVLHVRANDILWQKERILNLAIAALPATCTKVAWLDCDILFDSPRWAEDVAVLLDDYVVVQPYASVVRLPRGALHDDGTGKRWLSFGSVYQRDRGDAAGLGEFGPHGHTGFAWAARRDLLAKVGLYDACIAGSADHLMAHVFARQFDNDCVTRIVGPAGPYREHFLRWASHTDALVKGRFAAGASSLRHLWHGDQVHRRYVKRNEQLVLSSFDPERDIAIAANGCWAWRGNHGPLREWMIDYFASRKEDGDECSVAPG
jgi:hypothetical protein